MKSGRKQGGPSRTLEPTLKVLSEDEGAEPLTGCLLYICDGGPRDQGRSARLKLGPAFIGRDVQLE